jgi:hypothetical protein
MRLRLCDLIVSRLLDANAPILLAVDDTLFQVSAGQPSAGVGRLAS